ncbi:hypothetical protein FXO37_33240 [Capsicum annuum]|nr:hypothetical protein FXO37_33240 [Capsicum annuum]
MDSKELPEQSQSGKSEANERYENDIEGGREGSVEGDKKNKNNPGNLTGDFVLTSQLGKHFDDFRKIMKEEKIDKLLKKSCFRHFLELLEDNNARFQKSLVYGLLKCMIKWLAAKINTRIKEVDLFNPSGDAVVHLWTVPIEQELGMTFFIILGLVDTIAYSIVELIKKELAEATAIRRAIRQSQSNVEALHDQPAATNSGTASGVQDKLFEKVEAITKSFEELKSNRGFIPSKKVRDPYTPTVAYVDEILCLMRGRQLAYPNTYNGADRITDLNFYNNFKDRGKRPYPYDQSWTKEKRIFVVMNVEVKHFMDLEILLKDGIIKAYDCNLPIFYEAIFSSHAATVGVVPQFVEAE